MNVPIVEQKVQIQSSGGVVPAIQPITEAAFGGGVARAHQGFGKVVEGLGADLGAHMAAKQKVEEEHQVHDKLTAFASDVNENVLWGKDGVFSLSGAATTGAIPVVDERINKAISEHSKGLNPNQAEMFVRNAETYREQWRTAAIKHVAEQGRIADEQGISSAIKTDSDTIAVAPFSAQGKALREKALSLARDLSDRKGETPEAKELRLQMVDDSIAKATVALHPEHSGEILKTLNLSAEGKAFVQGAQVDAAQKDIAVAALKYKPNADGTPNLANTLEYADKRTKDFTPAQREQVTNYVHRQVGVLTSEINQQWEQNQKQFYNSAYKMFKEGKTSADIVDALVKKRNFNFTGYTATDKAKQEDFIGKLFTDPKGATDEAIKAAEKQMKTALDNIELMVNKKYPGKQKRDEAMFVFKQKALALPNPDVFQAEALKSLEGVVVSPAIFHDSKEHGWADELAAMRKESAERAAEIDKAIVILNKTGKTLTPQNVNLLINYWRTNPNDKRFQ